MMKPDPVTILDLQGTTILSVPHLAHAAVRLRRLAGAFARTSEGLLDPTHLHLFDRSSLHELTRHAGGRVTQARSVGSVGDTEIRLTLAVSPREAVELAAAGPDADANRFVVTVAPSADGTAVERMAARLRTLTVHLHRAERDCRALRERARDLERQVDRGRREHDRLREALEEARDGQRRAAAEAAAVREDFQRLQLERQQFEEQLATTANELVRCQLDRRFLRDDVLAKDSYLAMLRRQATQHQQSHADIRVLTDRLDELTIEHAAEVKRAADLALSNRELHQQFERARQELHRVHASVAETLAQPRYVAADRCNAWAKKAAFLHAALKRVWAAWSQGQ